MALRPLKPGIIQNLQDPSSLTLSCQKKNLAPAYLDTESSWFPPLGLIGMEMVTASPFFKYFEMVRLAGDRVVVPSVVGRGLLGREVWESRGRSSTMFCWGAGTPSWVWCRRSRLSRPLPVGMSPASMMPLVGCCHRPGTWRFNRRSGLFVVGRRLR